MKFNYQRVAILAAFVIFCAGLSAFGQVPITLTGVNGSYSAQDLCSSGAGCEQVYTGIYYATVNNVANTGIICDDFNHNVTTGETWNAAAINTSALTANTTTGAISGVQFGAGVNGQTGAVVYAEVADLVSEIFSLNNGTGTFDGLTVTGTDLSEAIWDITTNGHITGLSSTAAALVKCVEGIFGSDSTQAAISYLNSLNLWILTPSPDNGPQEMWTANMSVPEGGAAFLYLLLAALFCSWALFVRNRERAGMPSH